MCVVNFLITCIAYKLNFSFSWPLAAGKYSIVFDCVFSSTLKSRCTKDTDFRMYLIGNVVPNPLYLMNSIIHAGILIAFAGFARACAGACRG